MTTDNQSKKSVFTALHKKLSLKSERKIQEKNFNSESQIRVAVLGDTWVGKTAIIRQLSRGQFTEKYQETIEDLYKESIVDGPVYDMDILDTSGNIEYSCFRSRAIKKYDIFVLVFSVTQKSTFYAIKDLRNEILAKRKAAPNRIIVVGNKADEKKRFNSKEVLKAIVNLWGHTYVECSAKSNAGVNNVFKQVAKLSENLDIQPDRRDVGGVNDGSIFIRVEYDGNVDWKRLY